MALPRASDVEYIGSNMSGGMSLGLSATDDKVSLYGVTPVVQPTSASQAAVTATAVTATNTTVSITTAAHGFATGTQGDALITRVAQLQVDSAATVVLINQLRTELIAVGIIKGS